MTDPTPNATRTAAESEEWRRLVELCRAARDVETLAREFVTAHVRYCGCLICQHFARAGGPTASAARHLLRTVDGMARVAAALRAGAKACGPADGGLAELDRPAELTKRGIARARRRVALSRACADPKADVPGVKPVALPCG